MDCSPLSSSVHGILQARILEWVAHLVAHKGLTGENIALGKERRWGGEVLFQNIQGEMCNLKTMIYNFF